MTKTFHICTVVNNSQQYQEMRSSFAEAGFGEAHCRFSAFDNCAANKHERYGAFNQSMTETEEPYLIFCHQDILLDQGDKFEELLAIVGEVETADPSWAILGNAGVTQDHKIVLRVQDPHGNKCGAEITPIKVCSLDENFLLIKTASQVRCSTELTGFHLYATDLCLQAAQAGHSCYVVSFRLTHLSKGSLGTGFQSAKGDFQEQWSQKFRFRYLRTTCTVVFLGRNSLFRFFCSSYRVTCWLLSHSFTHKLVCRFSD